MHEVDIRCKNIGRLESRSAAQIVAHVSALTSAGISPRRNFIVCHVTPDIRPVFCTFGFENGHGFIEYPKGRNFERALGPSCPCVLCIPIHIITINIESFLGCDISHSLGLYLLHQI